MSVKYTKSHWDRSWGIRPLRTIALLVITLLGISTTSSAAAPPLPPLADAGSHPAVAHLQAGEQALSYSTYLGGDSWEVINSVAVDSTGALYLVGRTASADFPTTPEALKRQTQDVDAFIVKLPPGGGDPLFATLLGGGGQEAAYDVAVQDGRLYLCGETWSDDFPLVEGAAQESDAFLAVLDAATGELLSASTFGGEDQDIAYALALEDGAVYLAGSTYSEQFEGVASNPNLDAFALRLDPEGTIEYATLLGGRNEDAAFDIAVADGEAYLAGQTWSPDFPADGYRGQDDAFVVKLDSQGELIFSRLLGGSGQDSASALLLNQGVWIAGSTTSPDYPITAGVYAGGGDAFITWLDEQGETRFSTYIGGSALDEATGISLDANGNLLIAGVSRSADFPVSANAHQVLNAGRSDATLVRLAQLGEGGFGVDYATYLGGSGQERNLALALGIDGAVLLAGYTQSQDFPVTAQAFIPALAGSQDAFLSALNLPASQASLATPIPTVPAATQTAQAEPPAVDTPVSTQAEGSQAALATVRAMPPAGVASPQALETPTSGEALATSSAEQSAALVPTTIPADEAHTTEQADQEGPSQQPSPPSAEDTPRDGVSPLWILVIAIVIALVIFIVWKTIIQKDRSPGRPPGENQE